MAIIRQSDGVLRWSEADIRTVPEVCGVYTLRTGGSLAEIGYIGRAGNGRLQARLLEHWSQGDHPRTTHFCWSQCDCEAAAIGLEQEWIRKYHPPWNKTAC